MDYLATIKKAYRMALKNRFLWVFGLLAGSGGGVNYITGFPSYNYGGGTSGSSDWEKVSKTFSGSEFAHFWTNFGGLIIALLAILGVAVILMFILSVISQGALVGSVDRLGKGEKADLKIGFGLGWHRFWRVLGAMILYFLMILASLGLVFIPVAISLISGSYGLAAVWFMLLFVVCLIFWLLISLIWPYSLRTVVLGRDGVWQSIRESLHFVRRNISEVIVMYLLLIAVGIGFGLALGLATLLVGGILVLIGIALYLISPVAVAIYGTIAVIALVAVLAVITGLYQAFSSAALTLTYNQLKD